MPAKMTKITSGPHKGKFRVATDGVHAKHTTKGKAKRQARLLDAVEHGWKPTGKPAKKKKGKP